VTSYYFFGDPRRDPATQRALEGAGRVLDESIARRLREWTDLPELPVGAYVRREDLEQLLAAFPASPGPLSPVATICGFPVRISSSVPSGTIYVVREQARTEQLSVGQVLAALRVATVPDLPTTPPQESP
jgi:hypothetical protein